MKNILLIIGVVLVVIIGGFLIYINGLAASWSLHTPDNSPFYITTKPMMVKNIMVPQGTTITYEEKYFWLRHEQKRPLNEKDVKNIHFEKGVTINWAGVPITSINKFYNSEMKGFTVYADFAKLDDNERNNFAKLWSKCSDHLGITIENANDWSFNKKNILDIESCNVNYQRYFKDDEKVNLVLDNLYKELMTVPE